jgi:eukaryotic-like serine/threonine-protein kinase
VFTPVPNKMPMTPNKLALSPTPVDPISKDKLSDELGSQPLGDKLPPRPGVKPKPARNTIPPDPRTARPPAPTSKEGSSAWIIVLGLLLLGGGLVVFLVFGM